MAKDLVTKIILKGETDPSVSKAFSNAKREVESSLGALSKYGDMAKKAVKLAATATVASMAASVNAAIEYESAFAGVKKTVEETDTTKYEDISNAIRNMAKEMPATTTEIAAVAEAAGQLGIKADNISKFTEVMINLGETTNLSSEEAATAIAKMFNITGTSMDNVDRFGATIVALGNNAATTEADIVNMATRIASSATQVGMSEQELLALATSLSSVGMEAEAGGTAISTIMSKIDMAVALNKESVATWAETAGMSASQFKKAWEKDAYGAMQKIIAGMGDVNKDGGNLNVLLDDLGITGIRTADTMKRLSNASGLMSDMTDLANTAWAENSALTTEANTRYATMASRIQILKNRFNDVAITVGEALMPYVEKLMDKLEEIDWDAFAADKAEMIQKIADNIDAVKVAVGILATAFATFKTAVFINEVANAYKEIKKFMDICKQTAAFDKLKTALQSISFNKTLQDVKRLEGGLSGASTAMGKFASAAGGKISMAMSGIGSAIGSVVGAIGKFGMALLTSPITWIVVGIVALVAAFVLLWKKCEGFRNFWINLWNGIKSAASSVGAWLKNFFTVTIPNAWNTCVTWFQNGIAKIKTFFSNIGTTISGGFTVALNFIKSIPGRIGTFFSNIISRVTTWGSNMWAKAKEIGSNFVTNVIAFFKDLPYKVGFAIGYVLGTIVRWGITLWTKGKEIGSKFISAVVTFFTQLPGKIGAFLTSTWAKVTAWAFNMWTKAKEVGARFVNAVVTFFAQLPGRIQTWFTNTKTRVITWVTQMVAKARELGSRFIAAVVTFFQQLPGRIATFCTNAWQRTVAWASNMWAKAKEMGANFLSAVVSFFVQLPGRVQTFFSNVIAKAIAWGTNMVNTARTKAQAFLTAVITFFQQLPGRIQTFLTNIIQKVITWGANLVAKGKEAATNLYNAIVDKVKEIPDKLLEVGRNIVEGLWNGIQNAKDWLLEKISSFASGIMDGFKSAMGINSPSTIMIGFGQFLGKGLGIGIDKTRGLVGKAVGAMNNVVTSGFSKVAPVISPVIGAVKEKVRAFANGGTVTSPEFAVVGDAPETIVPHGNTPRNRALLNEAAAGVGATMGGTTQVNITFAPVIHGGSVEENKRMLQEEEEAFERKMDEYFEKKWRLAF